MRTAHLFAGTGGGLLGSAILGHESVLAVEWEESCCRSLRQRAVEGWFPGLHVHCGDIRDFDFKPWQGKVDCINAGFPCQDISCAGKGAGITGERSGLVSEVWRAIDDVQPGLVFLENSPNIRTRGREEVIKELVARGYSWKDGTLAASDVGAPHIRKRWWLLAANADGMRKLEQEKRKFKEWGWFRDGAADASDVDSQFSKRRTLRKGRVETPGSVEDPPNPDSLGRNRGTGNESETDRREELENGPPNAACHGCRSWRTECEGQQGSIQPVGCDSPPPNPLRYGLQIAVQRGGLPGADAETIETVAGYTEAHNWNEAFGGVCRMVHGISSEMVECNSKQARIKALGNAQVPLQAAAAWMMLVGA